MGEPAIVELELPSAPESVALVRATLKGFAACLQLDPELLDDLQMAVSEACNNVVRHAYPDAPGPLSVDLSATQRGVEMVVRDRGQGVGEIPPGEPEGLGLPLIQALADEAEITADPEGGTEVRMRFACEIAVLDPAGPSLSERPRPASALGLAGRVAATVAPVALLPGVLGRLVRAMAGEARFSIERFSEIHLLVDALGRLSERFATDRGVSFALGADTRRLRLRIGPFQERPGAAAARPREEIGPLVGELVDELEVEPIDHAELLCLTVTEQSLSHARSAGGSG